MGNELRLRCINCGREYTQAEVEYTCPKCGPAKGILEISYDYSGLSRTLTKEALRENRENSLWRYAGLLPVERRQGAAFLRAGWSPLYKAERLGRQLGLKYLYLKDDGVNPTASFKDRASALGVARALELGRKAIACASTGNAASSLAGAAACAGLKAYIFVPATAPAAKVTQLLIFGAKVFLVDGSYDQAYDLCAKAVEEWGWYNRNCAVNPYLIEGKKTAGLEICEQLCWEPPDRVVMSVGDGCSLAGVWKGFQEAQKVGLTARSPRLVGVQAEGSRQIVDAFLSGTEEIKYSPPRTLADSIAVGVPRNGIKALRAIRSSQGTMVTVTDPQILAAMKLLAKKTGVFAEPAAAAAMAGLLKMVENREIDPEEKVVVCVTGNGLKDIAGAQQAVGRALQVRPNLDEVRRGLAEEKKA